MQTENRVGHTDEGEQGTGSVDHQFGINTVLKASEDAYWKVIGRYVDVDRNKRLYRLRKRGSDEEEWMDEQLVIQRFEVENAK